MITTVRIAEKGRTLKALFAKNKGDISCKLLSEITFSRRFCSLPELLPDTYLRDASLATITPKSGFAPIFPDICYHLTHYKPAAADIPVASDNPAHYADAIRYNARTPLQGSLLPLTRLVWA